MARIITLTPNPALDFSFDAEKIEPNRKLRCGNLHSYPGGGGVNVGRAAHRLGADVLAIHTAGGIYGDALEEGLAAEAVPARAIRVAAETRPAFHAFETASADEYRFNFPGGLISNAEAAAILDALSEEISADDIVIGSGSLPPGAPRDFWALCARISNSTGAKFILDSTSGEDAALDEGLYLLRKNRREAAALAGRDLQWPEDFSRFAQEFLAENKLDRLVLTHRDNALMASPDNVVFAARQPVKVVSAVGAGDSFVAALATAMINGETDETALRYAMAGAGATLMSPGTSLFDPKDVERLFAENQ